MLHPLLRLPHPLGAALPRMNTRAASKWLNAQWRIYRAQLLFCIRVTVAAISALLIAQFFALPLHGLWVVLTATVVTQLSVGGSLRAGLEYILGTLGGALYAGIVGVLVGPTTLLAQSAVLAVTVAPLAFAAALNPNFRVAPFSAVLVLLISGQLGEGPIESALTRLLEVTLGGAVAVIVSFIVFPERAHRLAAEAAARVLDEMAKDIPDIWRVFSNEPMRPSSRTFKVGSAVWFPNCRASPKKSNGKRRSALQSRTPLRCHALCSGCVMTLL